MPTSTFQLILHASLLVKFVLLLLTMVSVLSWAVMFQKFIEFRETGRATAAFWKRFENEEEFSALQSAAESLRSSPLARLALAAFADNGAAKADRLPAVIQRAAWLETQRLSTHLTFLATTGSTSPFIGLFGTVVGIINAFQGIGASGSASLAVVAPGIAEALVTTAAGLAVAIPAVIAYNVFLRRAKALGVEIDSFAGMLLARLTEAPYEARPRRR